jgi:hypothetical protein
VPVETEPDAVVLVHEASRKSNGRHSGASELNVGWNEADRRQLGRLGIGFPYLLGFVSKVPEIITMYFWIARLLTTAMG